MALNDRRRINGPPGGTTPPIFASNLQQPEKLQSQRPKRSRPDLSPRKIFLKTGLIPSASGSAYYELSSSPPSPDTFLPPTSSLKISVALHGPHPLPRSAPYNTLLQVTTTVKFAPFAQRRRRGYVRDAAERDVAAHLETALRGVVLGERWPKSGVDVICTVLEGEEDAWWGGEGDAVGGVTGMGIFPVLAGCITAASAALVDAGVDCVDLVAGGVAALVGGGALGSGKGRIVADPAPAEHARIDAACVVGYLEARDEITELWLVGDAGDAAEDLIEKAVGAARATRTVLSDAVMEIAEGKFANSSVESAKDSEMPDG